MHLRTEATLAGGSTCVTSSISPVDLLLSRPASNSIIVQKPSDALDDARCIVSYSAPYPSRGLRCNDCCYRRQVPNNPPSPVCLTPHMRTLISHPHVSV
ncbi:unnamed protein product [Pieris brassicae]|uniref:Uncharacterized protein n=1 Tax=Pieris brassicae TaxID=7116 RepID=A0A9P0SH81_PIEBR|nr:unnamed protein product [Pieris brassicae]